MENKVFLSSFDSDFLDDNIDYVTMRGIRLAYNYNYFEGMQNDDIGIEGYAASEGQIVMVASSVFSPGIVKACHDEGKLVGVWMSTNQTEDTTYYNWLQDKGVDIVISNHPELTPSYIEAHPSHPGFWFFFSICLFISMCFGGYKFIKKESKE